MTNQPIPIPNSPCPFPTIKNYPVCYYICPDTTRCPITTIPKRILPDFHHQNLPMYPTTLKHFICDNCSKPTWHFLTRDLKAYICIECYYETPNTNTNA